VSGFMGEEVVCDRCGTGIDMETTRDVHLLA
jgi:hypothetical protein